MGVALVAAATLLITACIEGPIAGTPTLNLAIPVGEAGYETREVFLFDEADAFTPDAPLTNDGVWDVSVDEANSGAGFKTRMVVVRPTDASRFNGTVIVEWMNVTGSADLPVDWLTAHREFTRSGAMWVGVSAQSVGVNQLKTSTPDRYGSLVHPGDSYSYDIFSKAAKAIRTDRNVTGGLKPRRLIGTGQSQSAGRLVTYINAIQPTYGAFDGFLVHGRGAGGASLAQSPLPSATVPSPTFVRDDLDVPVLVLQAEDDVIRANTAYRQPDTDGYRLWEIAGGAHLDAYTSNFTRLDDATPTGAARMFTEMRGPRPPGSCAASQNAGGLHWSAQAAFRHVDTWIRTGTPPPVGPRLTVASSSPTVLERDAVGNALGGVRSPIMDAPIARLDGINSGGGFCQLFGSTTPLTDEQLQARYTSKQDYIDEFTASADALVVAGFLLAPDAAELVATATATAAGLPLP
jgi:hypothetical protein